MRDITCPCACNNHHLLCFILIIGFLFGRSCIWNYSRKTYHNLWKQYQVGVDGFLSFASKKLTSDGKLGCPCARYVNNKLWNLDVNYHLFRLGMMNNYSIWIFHRESASQMSNSILCDPTTNRDQITQIQIKKHETFIVCLKMQIMNYGQVVSWQSCLFFGKFVPYKEC